MVCNALDVFHDRGRVLEDIGINALQDVVRGHPGMAELSAVGVVNVAAAIGHSVAEFAAYLKLACGGANIVVFIHIQSLSG